MSAEYANSSGAAAFTARTQLDDMLGDPPLLRGEDPEKFRALLQRLRDHVRPADAIEEIWVRDVATLTWELERFRRYKAATIDVNLSGGLRSVIGSFVKERPLQKLIVDWERGDRTAEAEAEGILAKHGLRMSAVEAFIVAEHLEEIERIDHLAGLAEQRRNATIFEIEQRRSHLVRRFKEAIAGEETRADVARPVIPGS